MTESSTFTLKGLEGAKIAQEKTKVLPQSNSNLLDPNLFGTWLNTDGNKKKSGWQFNNDGTAVQYVRDKKFPGWTWEVRGGMLYIIGGNKKSEDYVYKFENGDLYIELTLLGKQIWCAPLSKR